MSATLFTRLLGPIPDIVLYAWRRWGTDAMISSEINQLDDLPATMAQMDESAAKHKIKLDTALLARIRTIDDRRRR